MNESYCTITMNLFSRVARAWKSRTFCLLFAQPLAGLLAQAKGMTQWEWDDKE